MAVCPNCNPEMEEIVERLARLNPIDDAEPFRKCRFCLAPNVTSEGASHTEECVWVAAVHLVLAPQIQP